MRGRLRPATASDAAHLAALILAHRSALTLEDQGLSAEKFLESVSEAAVRAYIESERYAYTVLEAEGEILGFIALRDRTHLFHLFVAQAHQRRGIARQLWESALRCARDNPNARSFTVNSSPGAVAAYSRFGFVQAAAPVQMHGIAFVPMVLALDENAASPTGGHTIGP